MSELIVAGYRDTARASQMLDALGAMLPDLAIDLDNAAVVRRYATGELRVQIRIEPTSGEGIAWSCLWGSLISTALYLPLADAVGAAASAAISPRALSTLASPNLPHLDHWWLDTLRLPGDLVRDIGALIRPNTSVLLVLPRGPTRTAIVDLLRDHRTALLYWSLGREEDATLAALITAAERHGRACGLPVPDLTLNWW